MGDRTPECRQTDSSAMKQDTRPESIAARAGRLPLIGRGRELAQLTESIGSIRHGDPRVVMVVGEAGIGKSRLLVEALHLMRSAGGTAVLGRCLDERGLPPYLPWIDALAELSDASAPELIAGGAETNLAALLVESGVSDTGPGSTGPSPEQRRPRAFNGVTRALAEAARRTPTLIAFDDLQWSDEASNALLRYVALHLASAPLLLIGAYRAEEFDANADLVRTVDELDRRRLLTTVRVGPLDANDTDRLVAALLNTERSDLSAAIHRHSEGNPFFIEEVVRGLAEQGRVSQLDDPRGSGNVESLPLPHSVVAVIQHRLARVGEPCRGVLQVAALAGRDIAIDVVAAAAELSDERVADLLDEAVRASLVRRGDMTAAGPASVVSDYVFLHDRVREAVALGINPVRRRAIHGQIGDTLAARGIAADDLAGLAALVHHFEHARNAEQAADAATRLGEAAMRAHAYGEAARAYRLALNLTATAIETVDRGDLLLRLGDATLAAGDGTALDAYLSAERVFDESGDVLGVARSRRRIGSVYARREEHDLAVSYLEAAGTALDEALADRVHGRLEDDRVLVLVELGTILGTSLGRYQQAIAVGRRALDLAEEAGSSAILQAEARLALGKSMMRAGQLGEGRDLVAPALALAIRAGNPDLAADATGALANHAYWIGNLDDSERFARRRQELALAAGDPYALRHVRSWLAMVAMARGEWRAAEDLVAEGEADVRRVESPEPSAFLRLLSGVLAFQLGRYSDAVEHQQAAISLFRSSGSEALPWYIGCLAQSYLAAGDESNAELVAAETEAIVLGLPTGSIPRAASIAQLGIIAVRRDDRPAMSQWYDVLRDYAGQHHWVIIDRVLGMLAAALGEPDVAEQHFDAAAAIAGRGNIRPEIALVLAERASMRLRTATAGDRGKASADLSAAVSRLGDLGMDGEMNRYGNIFDATLPVGPSVPGGLTERETEVLRLVAKGMTNREIGARLFISEKTVTNHLTHIFTKAGLDNRAGAVAFAHRHGLAG